MAGQRLQQVSINISASGDNTVLAALTLGDADKVRVIKYLDLNNTSNSSTTVVYKSGSVALNGAGYALGPNDQDVFDQLSQNEASDSAFKTGWVIAPGQAFIINLSGANQHSGKAFYSTEKY